MSCGWAGEGGFRLRRGNGSAGVGAGVQVGRGGCSAGDGQGRGVGQSFEPCRLLVFTMPRT